MWSKRLRRFAVPLQRLVRRFTIRKPCWICDRCGWRERREAEVLCWKCGGEMLFHRWPALRFGRDKRRQWYGQFVQRDGLRYAVHSTRLLYVLRRLWQERWRMKPNPSPTGGVPSGAADVGGEG